MNNPISKKIQAGFTLIELLVVIAIIGILASVVLASLNSARDKGSDAATKSNLNNARAQAELYYDNNSRSYANVCTATRGITTMRVGALSTAGTGNVVCGSNATAWAMKARMTSNPAHWYCVDSLGNAKNYTSNWTTRVVTACP